MNNISPEIEFLKISDIVGDKGANPPIPSLIPVCRSTWWNWVKAGKVPKGTKLSARKTVWLASVIHDIRKSIIDGTFVA